jgi:hypothetical protein
MPQSTKKYKPKGSPLPCFIPVALYESIRISCVYMALDDNPSNPLNAHREPILRTFSGNTVCIYSHDLLKQWLRFLCSNPLWSQTVPVDKETKSKRGYVTQTGVARIRATCIVVPTDGDIRSVAGNNQQLGSELTFVALQLRDHLLRRIGNEELYQPNEVPLGMIPRYSTVTAPTNVVKQDRLHRLGYGKIALKGQDAIAWDSFYRAESARLKYVLSNVMGTSVNDTAINSLNNEEAELHNSMMVANMLESAPDLAGYIQHGEYMGKANKGSAVNPALIAYQRTMASSKVVRADNPETKAYQDMVNEYHRLTGYRLDIKAERSQKSLPYRLHEIEWGHGIMTSNPYSTMGHNPVTNRMYPINSEPPMMTIVPPRSDMQMQQDIQHKMQNQRQQLFGNPPTHPKVQHSPSDVQKYMSAPTTYVPLAANTQKYIHAPPNVPSGNISSFHTSPSPSASSVPPSFHPSIGPNATTTTSTNSHAGIIPSVATNATSNRSSMFTVPSISSERESDEQEEEDVYYPGGDEESDPHLDQEQ